jgi:hypothetical protein
VEKLVEKLVDNFASSFTLDEGEAPSREKGG